MFENGILAAARRIFLALFLGTVIISSCRIGQQEESPESRQVPWAYAHLRILDPADAPLPTLDIVAAYTRFIKDDFQIRLDFLDIETTIAQDIYIVIDTQPGGTFALPGELTDTYTDIAWDVCLSLTAGGDLVAVNAGNRLFENLRGRIMRDPFYDSITVSLNRAPLASQPGRWLLQAFVIPANMDEIADQTVAFSSDQVSMHKASLIIAFWNTFHSETPAQALRSWDGAHTGLSSSRHGLRNLIEAVESTNIPIVLLDLKTFPNLSALDYMGMLPRIRNLVENDLLMLPGFESREVYAPELPPPFYPSRGIFKPIVHDRWGKDLLFGLDSDFLLDWSDWAVYGYAQPPVAPQQILSNELSLETRRAVLDAAIHNGGPLLLGGDFAQSAWGEPDLAQTALQYIAAHPWMHVLTSVELATYHSNISPARTTPNTPAFMLYTTFGEPLPSMLNSATLQQKVAECLLSSPNNPITTLAWQMYESLITPTHRDQFALRANYLGQIGHLITAAHWAEAPYNSTNCTRDIDWDGSPECVLATSNTFATLETDGGYLVFAFLRTSDGIHQIIGPTSQFAVGLSDPSIWNTQRGLLSDPTQILGALADSVQNWARYQSNISHPGEIIFSAPDLAIRKTFRALTNGIQIALENAPISIVHIPFVLDPWQRFAPDWAPAYAVNLHQDNILRWGSAETSMLEISATENFTIRYFSASHNAMQLPEDPNYDYTAGHYLPFPMAVIDLQIQGDTSIEIRLIP